MSTNRGKRAWQAILVSLILSPLALIFTVVALVEWPPHLFGEATEGVLVKLEQGTGETVSYYLEYDYWVDEVRYRKSYEEISLRWYKQLPDSGTVTVLYLPSAPHVARIEGNTFYRDGLTAFACWLDVFVLGVFGLMGIAARNPPETERAKRLVSSILVGELAMIVGTVIGWVGGLVVVGSSKGFIGLGVGLLAGGVASVYAWRSGTVAPFMRVDSDGTV